ncbi:mechanosensitive ion channel family protein [Bacteroides gallinaceum]|uniref:Mechanosensitive ion channel n=2 Tax=Bacteroidaceae TaxID=815 RepID=A0ABT7VD06_9BACE|nr:mechanosensitive ion channel domain-containing protein [Bacteroides gallinaceum]MBU3856201.1 mechanosensitive ion channel [Candidatus Phocaeicola excrementipullorum]MDM8207447.1 mechanosensitive ion channel [Bacteroides gallinaceum]MDM8324152.1 mechanosensitive ion channel [Bacteroides gallinaceum]
MSATLQHIMLLSASTKINMEAVLDRLIDWGIDAGKNIIGAILIFIIGRFIIKQINRLVSKILRKRKLEVSVETFLKSLLSILLNLVLAFAIISKLGIETTSIAALLASAGVAVGMALSGNLSNFAGGLIILVFKPFKVGDYIDTETADVSGTVKEIQIFHTVLATLDNKIIYVPNGVLSSSAITNYSKQNMRRAEWIIGIEYGEDVDKVKGVLEELIEADTRILKDPAPLVALKALSASSVDIVVRAWAKSEDYWSVYFDMNKKIYDTFNRKGIGFPFPQLTVHQAKD